MNALFVSQRFLFYYERYDWFCQNNQKLSTKMILYQNCIKSTGKSFQQNKYSNYIFRVYNFYHSKKSFEYQVEYSFGPDFV